TNLPSKLGDAPLYRYRAPSGLEGELPHSRRSTPSRGANERGTTAWPAAENGAVVSCSCCIFLFFSGYPAGAGTVTEPLRRRVTGRLQSEPRADAVQHLVRAGEQRVGAVRIVDDVDGEPDLLVQGHLRPHPRQHVLFVATVAGDGALDPGGDGRVHHDDG